MDSSPALAQSSPSIPYRLPARRRSPLRAASLSPSYTPLTIMSTRTLLVIAAVPALVLYQQHLRLSSAFPSLGVPSHHEISSRTDKPAIGMDRLSGESWRGCHAGDAWSVVVPWRLLEGHGGRAAANAEAGDDLALAFARAFWGSWPLQLEKNIVGFLAWHQLRPFALRKAKDGCTEEERRDFAPGAQVLGGLVSQVSQASLPILTWNTPSSLSKLTMSLHDRHKARAHLKSSMSPPHPSRSGRLSQVGGSSP